MPSWNVMVGAVLLASIAGLAWLLIRAQRQYAPRAADVPLVPLAGPRAERDRTVTSGSDRLSGGLMAAELAAAGPGGLSRVVAGAIESSYRIKPRNSAEAKVVETLRSALSQAAEGQFGAEVRAVIEGIDGVQSWHDIRKLTADGPTVDHLAVAVRGVFVIDSVVRSAKLSYTFEGVFEGRGPNRIPDPMIDELLAKVAVVAALVEPVPVQGMIVLEDRLSLPAEIRSPGVMVRGVQLTTVSQLRARLTTGLPLAEAYDVDAIWARLFPAFGPALDAPGHPFAATVPDTVPTILSVPR